MDAGTSRSEAIKLKKINHKWETGSGEVKETVQMRKMKRRFSGLWSEEKNHKRETRSGEEVK